MFLLKVKLRILSLEFSGQIFVDTLIHFSSSMDLALRFKTVTY